jgi:hypothetical protein
LAIDTAVYTTNFQSAGMLSSSSLKWIENIQRLARLQIKILISMMHHGVVEHFTVREHFFRIIWFLIGLQLPIRGLQQEWALFFFRPFSR